MKALVWGALLWLSVGAGAETLWLRGATVYTASTPATLLIGDVLVRDDRIIAVAADLGAHPLAATARVVDVAGKVITPGFLAPWSSVGSVGWPASPGPSYSDIHSAGYQVSRAYSSRSDTVAAARASGVLSAGVVPYNPLRLYSGMATVVSLDPASRQQVRHDYALVARVSSYPGRASSAVDALEQSIADARRYRRNSLAYERGGFFDFSLSRADLVAMQRVLDGEVRLMVQAHGAEEIRRLVQLAQQEQFRLIIGGGAEAYLVADELATAGVPVVLQTYDQVPDRASARVVFQLAHTLRSRGVSVFFGSDAYDSAERMRLAASQAVGWGLGRDAALRALTVDAASVLGLPDRGQIVNGKVADLVVWDGDPLETRSVVEWVMFSGQLMRPQSREFQLGMRYLKQPSNGRPRAVVEDYQPRTAADAVTP